MLRPRITPCLLVHSNGLVKTIGFGPGKYVGDPINAVRIFNEKEVDEIIVLDIDASVQHRDPDYSLIAKLAAECRMPLCYGGGVSKLSQFERIISLGVEKVAISSAAVANPTLVHEAAAVVGSQSVVVVMDVKHDVRSGRYELRTLNGTTVTNEEPVAFARKMEELGAGEIVVNSIDRDGEMKGYDVRLLTQVRNAIKLPMTALGGAGSLKDIGDLVRRFGIIGAGAGSLFVFKGAYKAVLINYPNRTEKDQLVREAWAARQAGLVS